MTGGIGIRETYALCGQGIDVWRVVERAALAGQIRPTQVINQKDDHIGFSPS